VKILHVEGGRHLYGGAQQVLYLLKGLQRRGIDNALTCPAGSDLASAAQPYAQVYPVPMGGDLDPMLIRRIGRCIQAVRPDLVHLHSRIGADVMGGIACRLAGVPVIHSRRVDNPEKPWVVRLKYRLHDRVVAISEAIGRVLVAEGLPREKLRIVRSAVDVSRFGATCEREKAAASLGVDPSSRWIGVIAQLIVRKGHRYLIDALPDLVGEFPDLRVLFFGQGPEEEELRRRITARGLEQNVLLVGFRGDLPRLLPCLELLVHPATLEGLGVSLLQASSAGVPIVASNVGGIPEAVRDGVNGLLVPPADVAALGEAIERLLRDKTFSRGLGEAGRKLMRTEFSADAMVDGNLHIYRELLAERSGERTQ
jgi:glycosyltransferase involved in cell wall biosynthesis